MKFLVVFMQIALLHSMFDIELLKDDAWYDRVDLLFPMVLHVA